MKNILITISILGILGILSFLVVENRNLKQKLEVSINNEKANFYSRDSLVNKNRVFKYTIEQLNYYNDSILNKLRVIQDSLSIKNKELLQLQYLSSIGQKKDSIFIKDTIFKREDFKIDTLIGNKWFSTRMLLEYPNTIELSTEYNSELYIITNYKKETINPPKKFFVFRWFQKKHKIIEVNIVEKNPYTKLQEQRFIEIIE